MQLLIHDYSNDNYLNDLKDYMKKMSSTYWSHTLNFKMNVIINIRDRNWTAKNLLSKWKHVYWKISFELKFSLLYFKSTIFAMIGIVEPIY